MHDLICDLICNLENLAERRHHAVEFQTKFLADIVIEVVSSSSS